MRYHLIVNLNSSISNPKSVTFVYSQLSHNNRRIFLHHYTIGYNVNPLTELLLKKRHIRNWTVVVSEERNGMVGEQEGKDTFH